MKQLDLATDPTVSFDTCNPIWKPFRWGARLSLLLALFHSPIMAYAEQAGQRLGHIINLGTAGPLGTYWPVGDGICDLINIERIKNEVRCRVYQTGGALYNIQALRSGDLDNAITRSALAYEAFNGTGHFADKEPYQDLRLVVGLYDQAVSVVVKRTANVTKLADIARQRIGLEKQGSGQRTDAELVMNSLGVAADNVNIAPVASAAEMSDGFCNGTVDVVIDSVAHPSSFFEKLILKCGGEIYSMTEAEIASIQRVNPGVQSLVLSSGLYKANAPAVNTYGYKAVLVSTSRIPDKTVTVVIDAITDNLPAYFAIDNAFAPYSRAKFSLEDISVPVHDGAKDLQRAIMNSP